MQKTSLIHFQRSSLLGFLLCFLMLLASMQAIAVEPGLSSDPSLNPSVGPADDVLDVAEGVNDISAQSEQIDIDPSFEPVAVILVDSQVVCTHQPVLFDGTESCLRDANGGLYQVQTITAPDEMLNPLHQTSESQTDDTTSTEQESQSSPQPILDYYHWEFGDASTANEAQYVHQFNHTGVYTVQLTVKDSDGTSDTANVTITVVPSQISGLSVKNPGTGKTLTLTWNPLPKDEVVYYQIFRNDRAEPFTTTRPEYIDSNLVNGHTYYYQITAVDYVDKQLLIGPLSQSISGIPLLFNTPPLADTGGPYFGWTHTPIVFDGTNSIDYDGNITRYEWDFGDGTTDTGKVVTHIFTLPGTYAVTLTITDSSGEIKSDTAIVTIAEQTHRPTANASGPYHGFTNCSLQFNGKQSHAAAGNITSYHWDFGDGTTAVGKTPRHRYRNKGTYQITLTITDESNQTNTDVTYAIIKQGNQPPTPPTITIQKKDEHGTYELIAQSIDPEDEYLRYVVDWGDHTQMKSPSFPSGTILRATHQWKTSGNFTIQIYVVDSQNASSAPATRTISITSAVSLAPVSFEKTIESFLSSFSEFLGLEKSGSTSLISTSFAALLIFVELFFLILVFRKLKTHQK